MAFCSKQKKEIKKYGNKITYFAPKMAVADFQLNSTILLAALKKNRLEKK